jgi:hypothetical protein
VILAIVLYLGMANLLVMAGTEDSVEIIKLDGTTNGCKHFPRLPFEIKGATGENFTSFLSSFK